MKYYFESINLKRWNMFERVEKPGHEETFIATQSMRQGDVAVLYVGKQDPTVCSGIYALGSIVREPYLYLNHPEDVCNNKIVVDIRITRISYDKPIVDEDDCKRIFRQVRSVHVIPDDKAELLAELLGYDDSLYPEEIEDPENTFSEGSKKSITVNAYERNVEAREKCIRKYGTKCQICGFDFAKVYGTEFAGKIHVHHIKPLCEIDDKYVVDPEKDLIPVCPNCHMVLHSKIGGVYTPDEVRQMIDRMKQ